MKREVAKKTQFEEVGRQRSDTLVSSKPPAPEGFPLWRQGNEHGSEDGSRNLVWEIRRMKHLELMLREISSRWLVMKKWGDGNYGDPRLGDIWKQNCQGQDGMMRHQH